MRILVFNCGSSSLKFELIEIQERSEQPQNARRLARGTFEEIGPRASLRMSDERGR
jgi:acetate kinase